MSAESRYETNGPEGACRSAGDERPGTANEICRLYHVQRGGERSLHCTCSLVEASHCCRDTGPEFESAGRAEQTGLLCTSFDFFFWSTFVLGICERKQTEKKHRGESENKRKTAEPCSRTPVGITPSASPPGGKCV